MKTYLALGIACLVVTPAIAQPTVDGSLDAAYGSALSIQSVQTEFGTQSTPLVWAVEVN